MRTIGVKLTLDYRDYVSGADRVSSATKDFTSQMDKAAKSGHLDRVADQAAKFGIAGVAAFGLVVKSAADFDKQMSAVSAATHANTQDMAALRAAALQAGKDTAYSATEAAKGITELSKAGVSTADVLGGGLKGALSLAAAGQLDVGEAAETAASAMTQFKLKGDQVPHVADLLAAAAGKAQGSVHDLGYALSQSGLVASQMGLSIEDATGTLAAFASAGLLGSDAGTSFKTMLLALQNPVPKTAAMMKELGINAYDASGNFVGIAKFAGILQDKLGKLTPQMRQQTLAQIFGNDAVRAGTILYSQGAKGIQGWIDKTNDAGYAASTAAKLTDNLSGDIERLKGSLETLAISSGSGANSGLRLLAQSLNGVVGHFLEMPTAVGATVTVLAGVGGVALLGLAGFVKLRKGLAEAVEQLNAMGPAGERAATGLSRAASVAGKATAVLAGLEVLGMVADHFGAAAVNVNRLTNSLTNFANTGKVAGELSDLFGKDMGNFAKAAQSADAASHGFWGGLNDLTSSIPGVGSAVDSLNERIYGMSFNRAKEEMTGLDSALVGFMNTTNDAGKASALWQQMLQKSGLSTEQLAALLPDAYKQLGILNTEAMKTKDGLNGAAGAATGAKGQIAGVGKQSAMSADDLKKLSDAIDSFINGALSADRAAIAFKQGQVDLTKELRNGAKTLSINTAEGRKNRLAVDDQIGRINELRKSHLAQGQSLDTVNKKYLKDIDGLRKSMLQAGFSKTAVDQLIGSYKKIPGTVTTKVSVVGDAAAYAKLQRLLVAQQAAQKGISISAANAAFNKNSRGFAEGGWTGAGAKYEPAGVVHADEFVVNKQSRQTFEKNNPGALDQINRTGTLPGYAGGGVVWPFPVNASQTKVMSMADALSKVAAAGPSGGGMTYKWIEAVVRAAFPGMAVLSDYRPGARTLSGNQSYHAIGRAVDFPPSRPLAEWVNARYKARTKELITPYNDLNIHNGQRHTYTGAIWNQHNFAGGNAHDHWAMANGGMIPEPVFGVGRSGRTYSFAENGPERVLPTYASGGVSGGGGRGGNSYNITISPTPLAHPRDIGREVVGAIQAYEQGSGRTWRTGRNAV